MQLRTTSSALCRLPVGRFPLPLCLLLGNTHLPTGVPPHQSDLLMVTVRIRQDVQARPPSAFTWPHKEKEFLRVLQRPTDVKAVFRRCQGLEPSEKRACRVWGVFIVYYGVLSLEPEMDRPR